MHSEVLELPENVTEKELLDHITHFNQNEHIDGILVQQPLPSHISSEKII